MVVRLPILAAAALACAACATVPGQPLPMREASAAAEDAPFVEQGRIQFTPAGSPGASAAWDERYVRGPAVNVALNDEGLWGGTIRDRAVLLRAADGRITGQGVNLFVTSVGPVTHVQGLWFGSMLRVDVSATKLSASPTAGVCGIELALADDGYWRGFGGCGGRIGYAWMTLEGVAGSMSTEMPQWLFAFLGALPSPQTTVFAGSSLVAAPRGAFDAFLPAEYRTPAGWWGAGVPCSPWNGAACGSFTWQAAGYPGAHERLARGTRPASPANGTRGAAANRGGPAGRVEGQGVPRPTAASPGPAAERPARSGGSL